MMMALTGFPTPKAAWVTAGDLCISSGGMKGRVQEVLMHGSLPMVRVLWTNGHEGHVSITQVRRIPK